MNKQLEFFGYKIQEWGALGDFLSALLSALVVYFLIQEYLNNKLAKHKESIYQLETDLIEVEKRLVQQTEFKTFSSLTTKFLLEESLHKYLDTYPDLKRYAMLHEELISRTSYSFWNTKLKRYNLLVRNNVKVRMTQNERELLKRLAEYCPNTINFLES
jgi:UDP-galactopyranose mutase